MKRTVEERVRRGIEALDYWQGMLSPHHWRSLIDLDKLCFANPDKGPLGQVFGSYAQGLKRMRILFGASEYGFRSQYLRRGDPAELKETWRYMLRTEPKWTECGAWMTRVIQGIRYTITFDIKKHRATVRAGKIAWSQTYTSFDSAKRAIRKHVSRRV